MFIRRVLSLFVFYLLLLLILLHTSPQHYVLPRKLVTKVFYHYSLRRFSACFCVCVCVCERERESSSVTERTRFRFLHPLCIRFSMGDTQNQLALTSVFVCSLI
ncbi:hypothetical protein KP509_06G047600 [Ceratopteris richardii]|uniref:Uncharacterized protein n=1 Tax=Ceratopteris richardii TaxID=49495 RepID=A0A8T2UNG3_CERRI|nr:hypothetical protein KP509_06G047600 [Ceratopteris richardii]